MAKQAKRAREYTPILITEWISAEVKAGVFYIRFRSGREEHELAMGPNMALAGIELIKRTMAGGADILSMKKAPAPGH
jgi:hypothetical protein